MRLTALDIREQQFRRIMRGFDPDEVVTFLGTVAGEYEQLVAENRDLRQRLLDLEHQIAEFQNMEKALRDTLLTAERVTAETRENAQKEAGLILREAEIAAQQATAGISAEILQKRRELSELQQKKQDYLFGVRALAESHLQMIDSAAQRIEEERPVVGAEAPSPPIDLQLDPVEHRASRSEDTSLTPLPSEVGGVIPSAVASAHGHGESSSAGSSGSPLSEIRPAADAGVPNGTAAGASRAGSVSGWAEASFEPGDVVPHNPSEGPVSAREAEHFRRGITSNDPLPSLLRNAAPEVPPTDWDPTNGADPGHGTDVQNPAHAVRPDGAQGD